MGSTPVRIRGWCGCGQGSHTGNALVSVQSLFAMLTRMQWKSLRLQRGATQPSSVATVYYSRYFKPAKMRIANEFICKQLDTKFSRSIKRGLLRCPFHPFFHVSVLAILLLTSRDWSERHGGDTAAPFPKMQGPTLPIGLQCSVGAVETVINHSVVRSMLRNWGNSSP